MMLNLKPRNKNVGAFLIWYLLGKGNCGRWVSGESKQIGGSLESGGLAGC